MKKLSELLFGTAGIPESTFPRNTVEGIKQVKKLGLSAMELEFVQSVNISSDLAPKVRQASLESDVVLTCHGQYFINLNSLEEKKLAASKQRIYIAAKRAFECGAWSMCFHPGFYQGVDAKKTYEKVTSSLREVVEKLWDEGVQIWVRPETTGKPTQFGSLEELLNISHEIEHVLPCIDFSHLLARTNGHYNTLKEFESVLELVEKRLGKEALHNMHIHAQGVEFTSKGERRHLPFADSVFNYKDLVKVLKSFSVKGIVICESPIMEKDALIIQQAYKTV